MLTMSFHLVKKWGVGPTQSRVEPKTLTWIHYRVLTITSADGQTQEITLFADRSEADLLLPQEEPPIPDEPPQYSESPF
jgi:hypothetical protein